jgi:hypothetical protein
MTWLRWIERFSGRPDGSLAPNMPVTLVTLCIAPAAMSDELGFYQSAEYDALLEWARMGRFILALASSERDELTLVCIQSPEDMRKEIAELPLVAAGLATADIRAAVSLRMDNAGRNILQ